MKTTLTILMLEAFSFCFSFQNHAQGNAAGGHGQRATLWPRELATNKGNQARKQRAQEQHGTQVGFYGTTFKPPRRRRARRCVETRSVPTHANMYGMEQELFDKPFLPQVLMRLRSHQVAMHSQFLQTLQKLQLLWPRTRAANKGNQARTQRAQEQHGAQVGFYGTDSSPPASCPHSTEGRQLVAAAVGALARARLDTRFV